MRSELYRVNIQRYPAVMAIVSRHSFPNETIQETIYRMFRKLVRYYQNQLILDPNFSIPPQNITLEEVSRGIPLNFLEPTPVRILVENAGRGYPLQDQSRARKTVHCIAHYDSLFEPQIPLTQADEILPIIKGFGRRAPAALAMDEILLYCSRVDCEHFLETLERQLKIRLIERSTGRKIGNRKNVAYIEVIPV